MLHLIFPLLFLIPEYSILLLALEGHSSTNLYSPGGAFTLMQPVVRAKSFPSCVSRAVFHCSRSPLYRLVCMSRVVSLWIYNQHDRSGSNVTFLDRIRADCHFSAGFVVVDGYLVDVVGAGDLSFYSVGCVFAGSSTLTLGPLYFSPVLRATGMLKATCLSKISPSDSLSSSIFI
jgi:hypothetical protein